MSLSAKLAAAVAIMLVGLGGIIFQQLARREYERIVESKRVAAVMVTTLAATSIGASVEFDDTDEIQGQLDNLGSTPSVSGAALYVGDHGEPRAHLAKGIIPGRITQPVVVGSDRIDVLRSITGKGGDPLAALVISFSLDAENQEYQDGRLHLVAYIGGLTAVIALLLLFVVQRMIIRPLKRLVAAAQALQKGQKADVATHRNDEIGDLVKAFETMGAAVLDRQERLQRELQLAVRIQTSILPRNLAVDGYEIAAMMWPATEVGGDYYDLLPAKDGCWLGIGDVSGHGLETGLVMLMIQSVVAGLIAGGAQSPREVVAALNRVLHDNIRMRLRKDDHATLSILRVSGSGRVTFAGAHEELVVWRAKTGKCETIDTPGAWVGAVRDIAASTVDSELVLDVGDMLLLYTDGVIEARDGKGKMFGIDRLTSALERIHASPIETIVQDLYQLAREWGPQDDDISMLLMKRSPAHD